MVCALKEDEHTHIYLSIYLFTDDVWIFNCARSSSGIKKAFVVSCTRHAETGEDLLHFTAIGLRLPERKRAMRFVKQKKNVRLASGAVEFWTQTAVA